MNEQLENLFDFITAGEWGSNQGTPGGLDTGVIRSANFTKNHRFNTKEIVVRSIEERKRQKKLLCHGDILIEKSGGSPDQPVGRVLFYDLEGEHTCSNFISILRPSHQADPKFLYYSLCNLYERGVVKNYQQQTTGIINLQLGEYLRESIFFPPLPEQKKIAEILSGIDLVLDRILARIQKLKYAKISVIESILKRGTKGSELIQSDGEEIPCSWQAKRLNQVCRRVCVGFVGTCEPFYRADGIPLIRTGNLKNGNLDTKDFKYVTREFHDKEKKSQLSPGDLLIARHGDFGSACIVPQELSEANCLNVVIIKPDYSVLLPDFLKITLNSLRMKAQFSTKAEGSTQKVISTTEIANSIILVPPVGEQAVIAQGISSIEDTIYSLELSHKSLVALKSSVVQELLSGRKRVSI
jgi:type I restriction enzyme S subunit